MDNNTLYDFFEQLEKNREKISASAKRSGISEDSAILLTIIYHFPKIRLPIKEELFEELKIKGLILEENGFYVTGKGAILAKSLTQILKSV